MTIAVVGLLVPLLAAWVWLFTGWLVASLRVPVPSIFEDPSAVQARIPQREPHGLAPVELERLSPRELRSLPGIGEARALAIARECWERGHLGVDELDSIPSIGQGTVDRIRAWLERIEARP